MIFKEKAIKNLLELVTRVANSDDEYPREHQFYIILCVCQYVRDHRDPIFDEFVAGFNDFFGLVDVNHQIEKIVDEMCLTSWCFEVVTHALENIDTEEYHNLVVHNGAARILHYIVNDRYDFFNEQWIYSDVDIKNKHGEYITRECEVYLVITERREYNHTAGHMIYKIHIWDENLRQHLIPSNLENGYHKMNVYQKFERPCSKQ